MGGAACFGPLKMYSLLNMGNFHCYVRLPKGTWSIWELKFRFLFFDVGGFNRLKMKVYIYIYLHICILYIFVLTFGLLIDPRDPITF